MEELRSNLAHHGYIIPPENLILDGELHRFPFEGSVDAGWFIGFTNPLKKGAGNFEVCLFGDWKTGEKYTFISGGLTKAQRLIADAQLKESQAKFKVLKKEKQERAAADAVTLWDKCVDRGVTPYMERKGITELYGARTYAADLIVPMRDIDGRLWGLQKIPPGPQKFFMPGQKTAGCFHVIGELKDQAYLCEGFATGVSIHMATGAPVIVSFTAHNLEMVARAIMSRYPRLALTICGDDDRFTVIKGELKNPGRLAAERAGLIAQAGVVFPVFKSDETKPTDFNDLHMLEGIDEVKAQLFEPAEPDVGFVSLGYEANSHIFYNIQVKDVFILSNLTVQQLYLIAPEKFWRARYTPPDGGQTNYRMAVSDLIAMSQSKGRYDKTRVRGAGVWLDRQRIVVNTGHMLIVDGRRRPMYWPESDYIYISTTKCFPPMRDPLTVDECKPLIDAVSTLEWENPTSVYYLCGWLAIARLAGALPVRPHAWLTGSSSAGKSTVLERIIDLMLGVESARLKAQGGSTEAGIRQEVQAASVPVIVDEFESFDKETKERHDRIIDLLKNTWSMTSGQVYKGGPTGTGTSYNLSCAALLSSVQVTLRDDTVKSRFTVLELKPHGDDPEQWKKLKGLLAHITRDYGERLFARSVMLAPVILKNYETFMEAITRVSRSRAGQQYGMLMSGYWSLVSDGLVDPETAEKVAGELHLDEDLEDRVPEEYACLNHLMTQIVRVEAFDSGKVFNVNATIGQIISKHNPAISFEELKKFGIIVKDDVIIVADKHAWLKERFENQPWINWSAFLKRLPGSKRTNNSTSFGSAHAKCYATIIPLAVLRS